MKDRPSMGILIIEHLSAVVERSNLFAFIDSPSGFPVIKSHGCGPGVSVYGVRHVSAG